MGKIIDSMEGQWRNLPIEKFSQYEVSDTGVVRRDGHIKKWQKTRGGYLAVQLYSHCEFKWFLIHRLVAMTFIPTEGMNTLDVNHKDGNKENNNVKNLEWCTRSQNHIHAYKMGLKKVSEKQRKAASATGRRTCELNRRQTKVACYKGGVLIKKFINIHAAYRWLNTTVGGAISLCCKGKIKTYKGYIWRYI